MKRMLRHRHIAMLWLASIAIAPALANNRASLENVLNTIDSPSAWQSMPATDVAKSTWHRQDSTTTGGASTSRYPSRQYRSQSYPNQLYPMQSSQNSDLSYQSASANTLSSLFTPQNMLKALFGGSPAQATSNSSWNGAVQKYGQSSSNAQDYLSTALTQASIASSAAERANSGDDKGARRSAAEEARYAAQAAQAAADSATAAASGASQQAIDLAAQARDAVPPVRKHLQIWQRQTLKISEAGKKTPVSSSTASGIECAVKAGHKFSTD